jgi:predicted lipase
LEAIRRAAAEEEAHAAEVERKRAEAEAHRLEAERLRARQEKEEKDRKRKEREADEKVAPTHVYTNTRWCTVCLQECAAWFLPIANCSGEGET